MRAISITRTREAETAERVATLTVLQRAITALRQWLDRIKGVAKPARRRKAAAACRDGLWEAA